MKNIRREQYIAKVRPYIGNSLIKVLIGERRVGKSYILMQLQEIVGVEHPDWASISINKELFEFDKIRDYQDLIKYVIAHKGSGKTALFLDEVQEITGFEKALRSFQGEGAYDIYVTGSNACMLSSELATMLAGRYISIHVYSLSYEEYLVFNDLEDTDSTLLRYMKFGGLPHLCTLPDDEQTQYEYIRTVFSSSILKDIVARYNIRNVRFLEDLIAFTASSVGSIVTANSISRYLKSQRVEVAPRQVIDYLTYLQAAFLIDQVKRQDLIGKKIFEIGDKYYFEDVGMRNARIGYSPSSLGQILENLVYLHLRQMGYEVTVGKQGDRKIDFVASRNEGKVYVQVAYTIMGQAAHDREFGNLRAIKDSYPKYVVSMDGLAGGNEEGVDWWHLRKFLRYFR